jgi:two-component system nitrate/nitrite response regulator NarL
MQKAPSAARLLIIDDHELFATALVASLVRRWPGVRISAHTRAAEGLEHALGEEFDLILCDISLPDQDGREVLRAVLRTKPAARICMLSANTERAPMIDAIQSGACGYLSKSIDFEEFAAKIEQALAGEQVYDDTSASQIIKAMSSPSSEPRLSAREMDILQGLARGETYETMAAKLFVSQNTLKKNVGRLYERLGVGDRASAVAVGFRTGLLL